MWARTLQVSRRAGTVLGWPVDRLCVARPSRGYAHNLEISVQRATVMRITAIVSVSQCVRSGVVQLVLAVRVVQLILGGHDAGGEDQPYGMSRVLQNRRQLGPLGGSEVAQNEVRS